MAELHPQTYADVVNTEYIIALSNSCPPAAHLKPYLAVCWLDSDLDVMGVSVLYNRWGLSSLGVDLRVWYPFDEYTYTICRTVENVFECMPRKCGTYLQYALPENRLIQIDTFSI